MLLTVHLRSDQAEEDGEVVTVRVADPSLLSSCSEYWEASIRFHSSKEEQEDEEMDLEMTTGASCGKKMSTQPVCTHVHARPCCSPCTLQAHAHQSWQKQWFCC
jgi:hypothetical protein